MSSRALVSVYKESTSTWVDLPCHSDYEASASTVVDSARNSKGVVVGEPILEDVAKIELQWNFLTVAQYSQIAQLFDSAYGGSFFNYVSYFDVVKGDFDSNNSGTPTSATHRIFYPNDRKVKFAHIKLDSDGKPIGYVGVQLHLIDTGKRG